MDEPPPPISSKPGTLIRRKYRVERLLGEGAVGVVVQATHMDLNKPVAIKILRPEWQTAEIEARFEREARVAARLPADHIARVTDVGQTDDGECYLVMELLVGRDLADEIVARGQFPIAEAVDLILQATAGVAEAHAAGLVHRDIKPANLFLVQARGRVNVKVLDFGLSKAPLREGETELTHTTSSFGTPQYMSPEQIQSAKHVDARSDQHALAMILFELLAGRAPYESPSLTSLTVAIATEPPPRVREFRPEVPEALDEAIDHALAKRPADRFPNVLAFARAIAPFAGDRARDPLELMAAALEFNEVASSPPALVSDAAKADDMRATAPITTANDLDRRPTVQIAEAEDDEKRARARASGPAPAQSVPDGERDPGPLTAEPHRTAARRRPKIAVAMVAAVAIAGSFVWALGFPAPSSAPADAPPSVPSSEPRAVLSVTSAPLNPSEMPLPGVSPAPPDTVAAPSHEGGLPPVESGSEGSARPSSASSVRPVAPQPRPPSTPRKRKPSSPASSAGQSARKVFGDD
jgi:serine/threonine protein kinase